MQTDKALIKIEDANRLLAECKTIQDAKQIIDIAHAAEIYAKRAKLSQATIQKATDLKLTAERMLGQMLKNMDKNVGGRPTETCTQKEQVIPTLPELGISRKESSQAQMLADLPEENFEEIKQGKKTVTQVKRELIKKKVKETKMPSEKYTVVYADPPWSYGNKGLDDYGHAERHYPVLSIDELRALKIKEIIEKNAVLFMWVTSPLLSECWPVIKAWGFKYKSSFVWDKVKHNFGHYNSVRHEFLLICTRGSCLPESKKLEDSVISIEKSKVHSEKPEYFRELIDRLYPTGKRLELFSRKETEGWDSWGNQIIKNITKKN